MCRWSMHWPAGIACDQAGRSATSSSTCPTSCPRSMTCSASRAPDVYHDVPQLPITGNSFAPLLADADAPATTTVQYFEQSGSRALVAQQDDTWWKAVVRHQQGDDFDTEQWELYDIGARRIRVHRPRGRPTRASSPS